MSNAFISMPPPDIDRQNAHLRVKYCVLYVWIHNLIKFVLKHLLCTAQGSFLFPRSRRDAKILE